MRYEIFRELLNPMGLLILLLVPVHQGLIELFKLTGAKVRRYYEALAWIVYGPAAPSDAGGRPVGWVEGFRTGARLVPERLGGERRRDWVSGAQRRLIESFVLRAVGDSPAAEVSDTDVENVVEIARSAAPPEVRRTVEVLDGLLEAGVGDSEAAARALRGIEPKGRVGDQIDRWIARLEGPAEGRPPVGVLLDAWRRSFIESHLEGELRARTALAHALKSAELRYHRDLYHVSTALAAVEALAVAAFLNAWRGGPFVFLLVAIIPFGILLIAPKATKSLLDAIVGIGARLRG